MAERKSVKLPAEIAGKTVNLGSITLPSTAMRQSRGGSPVIEATRTIQQGGCELLIVLTIYVKTKTAESQPQDRIVWM